MLFRSTDNFNLYSGGANAILFSTNGAEAMRLDSSGNLGIGTSSIPSGFKLYASGGNMLLDNNYVFRQKDTLGNNTLIFNLDSSNNLEFGSGQHSGGMTITTGNAAMTFTTNSSERMRIDSSGNVGIGVTPSTWTSVAGKSLQINNPGNSVWANGSGGLTMSVNAYYNSGWFYQNTGLAARYD